MMLGRPIQEEQIASLYHLEGYQNEEPAITENLFYEQIS